MSYSFSLSDDENVIRRAEIAERHLAGIVGDLERAVGAGRGQAEPRRLVEHGRKIAEQFSLVGLIVDGVDRGRRILDAEIVPVAASGDKILAVAEAAAVIEARRYGLEAAAVNADLAARRGKASAGDVEAPAVRSPYSAGSAPVRSDMLPMKLVAKNAPRPETPSGTTTPLIRV